MKLELRNIKHHKGLSEETPAYTATVYVNGFKACDVQNEGQGGPDRVRWYDKGIEARVTEYFVSLPKIKTRYADIDLDPCLEMWCHEQVLDLDLIRAFKRSMARGVVGLTPEGGEYAFKMPAATLDIPLGNGKTGRQILTERYPGLKILNGLSDEDLRAAIKAAAKAQDAKERRSAMH